ncbi:YveK family protein [Acholeplasma granularum]|uniref:YveK family protein n=1 Tax=Acholeplasma granularum TaxID=264635 RepID=UPI0004BBC208|nr:Wzz/FepE/Etk N-terminal domain-containing protein [Acholeplasma granularum]
MDLEQTNQESGLSLQDIFTIMMRNWILILSFTLLLGVVTFGYVTRFVSDQYKSTSEVLVQVPLTGTSVDTNTLLNSQRLIDTVPQLVKSDYIIDKARVSNLFTNNSHQEILAGLSNEQIKSKLSVESSNTSFIIRISYRHSNEDFTQVMTQVITTVLIENDVDLFKDSFTQLSAASSPIDDSPNRILYMIIGLMGGAIIGTGLAFVKHLFSNTYMTKEQLEQGTGMQVIGVIPEFEVKEGKRK